MVSDLPYDILHYVCNYLSAVDVSSLLSSCRFLHRYSRDASIWKLLSARYGLRDITYFGGVSFYTAYTQLLHPYGPLIGLWASDYPYKGGVIEFRFSSGDEQEQGGIVGDLWDFAEESSTNGSLSLPKYTRFLKVGFDGVHASGDVPATAHVSCSNALVAHLHESSVKVLPPSNYGWSFHNRARSSASEQPSFPDLLRREPWYDAERGLPRLRPSPLTHHDPRDLWRRQIVRDFEIIYSARSDHEVPSAISIECTEPLCTQPWHPHLPFVNLTPAVPPRYYPLKQHIQQSVDPDDDRWSPETLEGLWLGSYDVHGTELLYLSWCADENLLCAHKVTGDPHVPRGARTWAALVPSNSVSSPLNAQDFGMRDDIRRVFRGSDLMSVWRSCRREIHIDVAVGVAGPDELHIWWQIGGGLMRCVRYTGRKMSL
ncbi:uncharacterized protein LAESUDRAFT_704112 [Laetiporus sulphureus 93-53]|uniref:F-box domain-containing protein n=1 Tax=Laetiporus sulphureus 93-53 TaxID=1314785 RepID=A0A165CYP2_9APHY|nr:uncharacterized protein LAESUDRAFT_704112 [Laetiporus sulphureus 93-53]KZT03763.1 hypothetical protein LAESUDRAFT_704112 [Laetiporus sulphureus 93-53]